MAFGNRSAATYDVAFRANVGQFRADVGEAKRVYEQGIRGMSSESLKLALAQEKLDIALAKTGGQSRQTARAELELRRVQGEVAASAHRASSALASEERSLGRLARGAVAGSGVMHGLGRSVAFASTTFLGGAGLVYGIKASINAATEQQAILANLRNALQVSGVSWKDYGKQIEAATTALKRQAAFDDEDLYKSLQILVRGTGDVTKSLRLNAEAADIARARNKGLVETATALAKAAAGQETALRRLVPGLSKTEHGYALIEEAARRSAGAAAAYAHTAAGAQDRFRIGVQDLEKAIGRGLLPTFTNLANKASDWLNDSKNQARVQRDVNEAVHAGAEVAHGLGEAIHYINLGLGPLVKGLGGVERAVELAFGAVALAKIARFRRAAAGAGAAGGGGGVGGFLLGGNPAVLAGEAIVASALINRGKRSQEKAKWDALTPQEQQRLAATMSDDQKHFLFDIVGWKLKPLPTGPGRGAAGRVANRPDRSRTTPAAGAATVAKPLDRQTTLSLNLARAEASGDQAAVERALRDQAAFDARYIRIQERLLRTDTAHRAQHAATLQRLYGDLQSTQDRIDSIHQQAAQKAAAKAAEADRKLKAAKRKADAADRARLKEQVDAARLVSKPTDQEAARLRMLREFTKIKDVHDKIGAGASASVNHAGNIAEFLTAFGALQPFRGNYFPPQPGLSTGKLETHGYDTVNELRRLNSAVRALTTRNTAPATAYAQTAAFAAQG